MKQYFDYLKSLNPQSVHEKESAAYFMFKSVDEHFLHMELTKKEDDSICLVIGYTGGNHLVHPSGICIPSLNFLKELLANLWYIRNNFPLLFE